VRIPLGTALVEEILSDTQLQISWWKAPADVKEQPGMGVITREVDRVFARLVSSLRHPSAPQESLTKPV
jgi:hypothetical protein